MSVISECREKNVAKRQRHNWNAYLTVLISSPVMQLALYKKWECKTVPKELLWSKEGNKIVSEKTVGVAILRDKHIVIDKKNNLFILD
jgi:hypothetical protein